MHPLEIAASRTTAKQILIFYTSKGVLLWNKKNHCSPAGRQDLKKKKTFTDLYLRTNKGCRLKIMRKRCTTSGDLQ
jgi:hypothetical protein